MLIQNNLSDKLMNEKYKMMANTRQRMLLLVFLKALQWGKVEEKMYILCIYIWLYVYDLCGKKKRDSIGCL